MREVVAGSGASLQNYRIMIACGMLHNIRHTIRHRLHKRREMAIRQERFAGVNHLQRIALMIQPAPRRERDITLLGYVIRMPRFGDEATKIVLAPKRGQVYRVREYIHDLVEHVVILPRLTGTTLQQPP